jgi:hypothetical protein
MPPIIQTIKLPSFLPFPGDQLRNSFPANHDSLSSMLGLCLAYLKHMHPAKCSPPDESARASAHILNLLFSDPLVQTLLPKSNLTPTAPAKELSALQICLTSLENMLANLAKATSKVRKDLKSKPNPPAQPAKQSVPTAFAPHSATSYAAKAASPQHPSVVVDTRCPCSAFVTYPT